MNKIRGLEAARRAAGEPAPRSVAYRLTNSGSGPARVDVYDDIGDGGWFGGGVTPAAIVEQLAGITGDVEVHINSAGGDVFDGIAIYNALSSRQGVTTVVDGIAASIASVIAQAGQARVIAPGAMMMIHDALSVCMGNAADMREVAGLLDQVSDNLAAVYASKSGTPAGWRDAMQAETWYTAQQAIDAGLADKLADRPASPDAVAAHDLSGFLNVPPVLRAASRRVLGIESMPLADKALPVHHTATVDEPWDGPAAVAAMPDDDTVLKYCHAWEDSEAAAVPHREGDDDADDQKANYKFPHHKTKGGAANLAACRNGLARLPGSGADDKTGIKAHLQAHLDDGGGHDDHAHEDISGAWTPELTAALKEAFQQ